MLFVFGLLMDGLTKENIRISSRTLGVAFSKFLDR